MKDTENMTKSQAKGYILYLKSHCDEPDYEDFTEANNLEEAIEIFYQSLRHYGWNRDMIAPNVEKEFI